VTIEQIDLATVIGDTVEIPCGFRDCDSAAKWVVWTNHQCQSHVGFGFMCDPHLQRSISRDRPIACTVTGERFDPGRLWINRFELIDHKTTGARR
jgi:hypothetical protein